jgi:septum site-determining protein MinD
MGKIFAVTSGKGGVGKSSFSSGLACAFAPEKNVLLVDMDAGLRCLDLMLGVSEELVFDLSDVLLGKPLDECVCTVKSKKFKNLHLLAAPTDTNKIDTFSFTAFAKEVAEVYDVVIFDFPAGVDFSLAAALPKDTMHLIVVNPDVVCIRDAAEVVERISEFSDNFRMILNKFNIKLVKSGVYKNIDESIDKTGIQLGGIVPYCEKLACFVAMGKPISKGRAFKAFKRISKRLNGEKVRLPKPKKI